MASLYFDESEVMAGLQATRALRPKVEPVEGAASASGAVFRVQDSEIFVSRRWQPWKDAYWCIIDFTSPLTGYVDKRCGGLILNLMKNEDGSKLPLMPEDEEALYRYFTLIVESDLQSLRQKYPIKFKVEILRLYSQAAPPATTEAGENDGIDNSTGTPALGPALGTQ